MGVTEIALLPLQTGKVPDDQISAAGKVHAHALDTLLSQPGVRRVYWGRQVEDPSLLTWFVDWNDIEDHKRFMSSDAYAPFLECFGSILGAGAKAYHARFDSHLSAAALGSTTAPVTEIATLWFPTAYSQEDQDKFVDNVKRVISIFEKEAKGYGAYAGGWVDEDIDTPGTAEKGKAYVLLTSWSSVEAHLEFQATLVFKENIHYVTGAKDLCKLDAVHIHMTAISRASKISSKV